MQSGHGHRQVDLETQQYCKLCGKQFGHKQVFSIQWYPRAWKAGGGTIPPEVCITNLKPDITILDKKTNSFHIFELTCPLERNIEIRHLNKTNKYSHFTTDISHLTTTVTAFEISSLGHITQRNKKHLLDLHKFCKKGTQFNTFRKNISALSIYSSYHIWLCRNDPLFVEPPFLQPPFLDKAGGVSSSST